MTKCSLCSTKIQELFLEKIKGTIIYKPGSSKQYPICFDCQKKSGSKEEMIQKL